MVIITSGEQFEEWLKDKPRKWAQVLAARSALRALPYAFYRSLPIELLDELASVLMRSVSISWAASSFSAQDMKASAAASAASAFAAFSASDTFAAHSAFDAQAAALSAASAASTAAFDSFVAAAAPAYAFDAVRWAGPAPHTTSGARAAQAAAPTMWRNTSIDCDWLVARDDMANAARDLTRVELWWLDLPVEWLTIAQNMSARLGTYKESYQVWIDWYNRRIEGHDASFDIPGDTDRIEDKAILARLAAATDDDFWGNGAVYVNITLQGWIDDARVRSAVNVVPTSDTFKIGSDAELEIRRQLVDRLETVELELAKLKEQLAARAEQGQFGIGHNMPPFAERLQDDEVAALNMQVASLQSLVASMKAELAKPEPDVGQLAADVPKLNQWGKAMSVIENHTSKKVVEGIETWVGPATMGGFGYLAIKAIFAFCDFFQYYWRLFVAI